MCRGPHRRMCDDRPGASPRAQLTAGGAMRLKRRRPALFACLVTFGLVVAACSGDDAAPPTTTAPPSTTTTIPPIPAADSIEVRTVTADGLDAYRWELEASDAPGTTGPSVSITPRAWNQTSNLREIAAA